MSFEYMTALSGNNYIIGRICQRLCEYREYLSYTRSLKILYATYRSKDTKGWGISNVDSRALDMICDSKSYVSTLQFSQKIFRGGKFFWHNISKAYRLVEFNLRFGYDGNILSIPCHIAYSKLLYRMLSQRHRSPLRRSTKLARAYPYPACRKAATAQKIEFFWRGSAVLNGAVL